jgi:hypothetical protein
MAVARWFSRALRYGVTANPLFAVRNLIRDTENSIAVSRSRPTRCATWPMASSMIDAGDRLKNLARAMAGQETRTARGSTRRRSRPWRRRADAARLGLGRRHSRRPTCGNILDTPGKLRAFGRYVADVAGAYKETLAAART